ncbi:MAG: hypothetical protein ACYC35_28185, partial [Pirellulales bacterium]
EAAGKTPQDLQTEVNRLLDRRRLRAKLAEYPRLHAEVTTAEIARAEVALERDRASSPWSGVSRAIGHRETQIAAVEVQLDAARRRMAEVRDGSAEEAVEDLRGQVDERRAEVAVLRSLVGRKLLSGDEIPPDALPILVEPLPVKIDRITTYLAELPEASPLRQRSQEHLRMLEAALAARQTQLASAKARLAEVETQLAEAQAELAEKEARSR